MEGKQVSRLHTARARSLVAECPICWGLLILPADSWGS